MVQLKIILGRLKKPSVILSLISQILSIFILYHVDIGIDIPLIRELIITATTVLITLGIVSNPNSEKKGYGDDILKCSHCDKKALHIKVADKIVCQECGCIYKSVEEIKNKH